MFPLVTWRILFLEPKREVLGEIEYDQQYANAFKLLEPHLDFMATQGE
jgi:hypothetical protein